MRGVMYGPGNAEVSGFVFTERERDMKATKYITIDCDGKYARMTAKAVRVEPWEVCFPLEINIPDSYFQRPALSAKVEFEDFDPLITEVQAEGVREAVLEATGMTLQVTVQHRVDEGPSTNTTKGY